MPNDIDPQQDALRDMALSYPDRSPQRAHIDIDLSLLEDSLRLTPWERMLANDDALNFAESLRVAMKRRNAKPQ
jgi:hypothetical protein